MIADVIVLPNSARPEISSRYTSPLKLFEAMAAGRAILDSDLPSLREVLRDGENARMVPPDDAHAMAAGLDELFGDEELRRRLERRARAEVAEYDWQVRAARVAGFLRERLSVEA